jgi:hypothetical protein
MGPQGDALKELVNKQRSPIVGQRFRVERDPEILRPASHGGRISPKVRFRLFVA